jgi:GNAT superfamily N-acetyltransferase
MYVISSATPADIPSLRALLAILFTQEADFQPDAARQSAALQQIMTHPETGHILTLREEKSILGMVILLYTISTACGGRAAWLEDMVVNPLRRNKGLGGMLLEAAIAHARSEGCLRITLLTDHVNDIALRLYGRHGFVRSEMMPLRLSLE